MVDLQCLQLDGIVIRIQHFLISGQVKHKVCDFDLFLRSVSGACSVYVCVIVVLSIQVGRSPRATCLLSAAQER